MALFKQVKTNVVVLQLYIINYETNKKYLKKFFADIKQKKNNFSEDLLAIEMLQI